MKINLDWGWGCLEWKEFCFDRIRLLNSKLNVTFIRRNFRHAGLGFIKKRLFRFLEDSERIKMRLDEFGFCVS